MSDLIAQFVRIILRYIAAVLVTKGVSNEPLFALLENETTIQFLTGILIALLTEAAWVRSLVKKWWT